MFTALRYNKLISNNLMKNQPDKGEKVIKVNKARQKQMKMVTRTMEYDMEWWRRCEKDHRLMWGRFGKED